MSRRTNQQDLSLGTRSEHVSLLSCAAMLHLAVRRGVYLSTRARPADFWSVHWKRSSGIV